MKYYISLGSLIRNDARCICEVKSGIAMDKAAFKNKKTIYTKKLDLNLRNKLMQRYCGAYLGIMLEFGQLEDWIRSNLEVSICGGVEGWRRPDGLIM
jgi:hypothetical protein